MGSPAEEHRQIAAAFTTTVEGTATAAWDNPAPVDGWVARDIVMWLMILPIGISSVVDRTYPRRGSRIPAPGVGARAQSSAMKASSLA